MVASWLFFEEPILIFLEGRIRITVCVSFLYLCPYLTDRPSLCFILYTYNGSTCIRIPELYGPVYCSDIDEENNEQRGEMKSKSLHRKALAKLTQELGAGRGIAPAAAGQTSTAILNPGTEEELQGR